MDNQEKLLLESALELLHKLLGYFDSKQEFKPILRFVDDPKVVSIQERLQVVSGGEKENPDLGKSGENVGFVEFSEKELQQMPKQFKTEYRINKKTVRVRYHKCGKNCYTYEFRYRANGYNISASGKTIEKAKANFLEKLKTAQQEHPELMDIPTTFSAFALYFFENFRKKKVSPQTYKCDTSRLKLHILPHFKEMPLKRITPAHCQVLVERLIYEGKGKSAEEIYSLLTIIFKAAILHNLIDRNPLALVQNVQHESEHGSALTRAEEERLFAGLTEPDFVKAVAIALYTGLRPNELKSAKIEGEFIVAINSKRKKRKVVYKKIPILKRLRPYLTEGIGVLPSPQLIRRRIKEVLPEHKLYDLRTTFYTKCQECGVESPARDEFVGHSQGVLEDTYTKLSDEYLLKEGKKLDQW